MIIKLTQKFIVLIGRFLSHSLIELLVFIFALLLLQRRSTYTQLVDASFCTILKMNLAFVVRTGIYCHKQNIHWFFLKNKQHCIHLCNVKSISMLLLMLMLVLSCCCRRCCCSRCCCCCCCYWFKPLTQLNAHRFKPNKKEILLQTFNLAWLNKRWCTRRMLYCECR